MLDHSPSAAPTPIGMRVAYHLEKLSRSPAWLAERVGVQRSTISRLLKGERTPTFDTLQEVAVALGVSLEELAEGTDAEDRIASTDARFISREHFDAAVSQMVRLERDSLDLRTRLREAEDSLRSEVTARREAEIQRESLKERLDDATTKAAHYQEEARRNRDALDLAVADVGKLRVELEALSKVVDGGSRYAKVAAAVAGIAAVASVAAYLSRAGKRKEPPAPKAAKDAEKKGE